MVDKHPEMMDEFTMARDLGIKQIQENYDNLISFDSDRESFKSLEERRDGIIDIYKNTMAGDIRDEQVLGAAEREANLSAYNALGKDELRLSQYTDDAGGQLYKGGKNIYSGKTFQEEFLSGNITTAPGVTKTFNEMRVSNVGGGGIMGDIGGLMDTTGGRVAMGIQTMGMSEVGRYAANKGLLGETAKGLFGSGGQRYG